MHRSDFAEGQEKRVDKQTLMQQSGANTMVGHSACANQKI